MAGDEQPTADSSGQSKPKRAINDVDSSFYLHPSDHPGLRICSVVLKGANFQDWFIAIRNAFRAKGKMRFLEGQIPKPVDAEGEEDWYRVNSMLIGWIIESIDASLRNSITYGDSVATLWTELQHRFSVGNAPMINQIRSDIAQCRQRGQSVEAYYGIIKKLWDDLAAYAPTRSCHCEKCTCSISSLLIQDRDEEHLHQFLLGLDDAQFSTVRSNILSQDPLPPIHRAYALVIQEERQRTIVRARDATPEPRAFAAQSQPPEQRSNAKTKCTHCGRNGHEIATCYRLHDFPEGWTPKPRRSFDKSDSNHADSSRDSSSTSRSDNGTGRGRGRGRGAALAAQQGQSSSSSSTFQPTAQDRSTLGSALNNEQWQTVLNLFASLNPNSGMPNQSSGPQYEDGDWSW